jgi:hypothetical protein
MYAESAFFFSSFSALDAAVRGIIEKTCLRIHHWFLGSVLPCPTLGAELALLSLAAALRLVLCPSSSRKRSEKEKYRVSKFCEHNSSKARSILSLNKN